MLSDWTLEAEEIESLILDPGLLTDVRRRPLGLTCGFLNIFFLKNYPSLRRED